MSKTKKEIKKVVVEFSHEGMKMILEGAEVSDMYAAAGLIKAKADWECCKSFQAQEAVLKEGEKDEFQ